MDSNSCCSTFLKNMADEVGHDAEQVLLDS